ncbi:very long chain fatty acid elongase 6-like [Clavelina lepadiformis]|uniref:very long chain fatty acid elongase 6-like n=1 Tax=Clavelina lepadiformis TaxID=159417 RepID=UPI0040416284
MDVVNVSDYTGWEFEKSVQHDELYEWLERNFHLCWGCAIFYVAAVFSGQKYMESKPRFNLRQPMLMWSIFLAIFSIMGTVRCLINMLTRLNKEGVRTLICHPQIYDDPILRFWGAVFIPSKVLEYIDTAFIVLRKQKLIFLHWYHHVTVSLFTWWCLAARAPGGPIYMTVNLFVHALMYTYYAARAARIPVPKPIAISITVSQIMQMVIGCTTISLANLWRQDNDCRSSFSYVFWGGAMYASYLVLFMHFFYNTYLKARPKEAKKPVPEPEEKETENRKVFEKDEKNTVNGNGYSLRERKRTTQ